MVLIHNPECSSMDHPNLVLPCQWILVQMTVSSLIELENEVKGSKPLGCVAYQHKLLILLCDSV